MRILCIAAMAVLCSCESRQQPKAATPPPAASSLAWPQLTGAAFTLDGLTAEGKAAVLPATRRPTIQFLEQNRVGGNGSVNRYSTSAALQPKSGIAWTSPVVATKMAGPPEAMQLEDRFFQALEAVSRIELQGGTLRLSSADGKTVLTFSR